MERNTWLQILFFVFVVLFVLYVLCNRHRQVNSRYTYTNTNTYNGIFINYAKKMGQKRWVAENENYITETCLINGSRATFSPDVKYIVWGNWNFWFWHQILVYEILFSATDYLYNIYLSMCNVYYMCTMCICVPQWTSHIQSHTIGRVCIHIELYSYDFHIIFKMFWARYK